MAPICTSASMTTRAPAGAGAVGVTVGLVAGWAIFQVATRGEFVAAAVGPVRSIWKVYVADGDDTPASVQA